MAPIESLQLAEYASDLGFEYENIKFKMKRGRSALGAGCGTYEPSVRGLCPTAGRLFKPRALVVTFTDGESARFPVALPGNILPCIQVLKRNTAVACIDLDGEEWNVVPPTLGNYQSSATIYALPTGAKSEKVNGSYDYTSDVLGLVGDKYAVEQLPEAISTNLLGCLDNRRDKDRCVIGSGVKARHIKIIANGSNNTAIVRKGKVSTLEGILECIEGMSERVLCVGYKGESIRNAHLLVAGDSGDPLDR